MELDIVERMEKAIGRPLDETEKKVVAYVAAQAGKQSTCKHEGWKGLAVHGRRCLDCGAWLVDFGD